MSRDLWGVNRWRDEVPRGEKMLYSGTDPESYITEYTLVYEDKTKILRGLRSSGGSFDLNDFGLVNGFPALIEFIEGLINLRPVTLNA